MSPPLTRVVRRPGRFLWLWAVWMALWGRPTLIAAVSGGLVATAILLFFPFREIGTGRRFHPIRAAGLAGRLLADLVPSALAVAGQLVRTGPRTPAAIVAVPLRSRSELLATLTANAVSLAPGAFVLEIDHEAGVLYVYALADDDPGAVDRIRADVLDLERRVIAAFDSSGPGSEEVR